MFSLFRDLFRSLRQPSCVLGAVAFYFAFAGNILAQEDDLRLAATAQQQAIRGAMDDAFSTAAGIADDSQRNKMMGHLSILRQVSSLPDGQGQKAIQQKVEANGGSGGLTEADYENLIDLITGSISPESWIDTGSGLGTIQPFPAGVHVDASGVLKKAPLEPELAIASTTLTRPSTEPKTTGNNVQGINGTSTMRIVSLNALEKAAQLLTAQGKPLSDAMKNLAGLTEIQCLAFLPESKDIVIAGSAGPWEQDAQGRSISKINGKPVLQLDDFVVCLVNAMHAGGRFGCAITPRRENLAATKRFLATSKLKGTEWRTRLQNVMGQQDIEVFGISPSTHAAYVLVEADYRMKLIGMGLEPSIDEVPSYLDRVEFDTAGNPPPMDIARWWFTLSYDEVTNNDQKTLFSFVGAGVKVLSETEFINDQGERIHTGDSVGPTKSFAEDFTVHFSKMAQKYPIYQELKNVFDLAMVANLIHIKGLAKRASWTAEFFAPRHAATFVSTRSSPVFRYLTSRANVPRQVQTIMNNRQIRHRVNSKTKVHTIVGVSGGISADVGQLLAELPIQKDVQGDETHKLHDIVGANSVGANGLWWWDAR